MLESVVRDRELDVSQARERIENATKVLESAKDARELQERIQVLESQERKLKIQVLELCS